MKKQLLLIIFLTIITFGRVYAITIDDLGGQLDAINAKIYSLQSDIEEAQKRTQTTYTKSRFKSDVVRFRSQILSIKKLLLEAPTKPVRVAESSTFHTHRLLMGQF